MSRENAWKSYQAEDLAQLEKLCGGYKAFLDAGKTERECVRETVRLAKEAGFADLQDIIRDGRTLQPGDGV